MTKLHSLIAMAALAGLAAGISAVGFGAHALPPYPRLQEGSPRRSKGGRAHWRGRFAGKSNPAGTKLAKKAEKGTLTKCGIK